MKTALQVVILVIICAITAACIERGCTVPPLGGGNENDDLSAVMRESADRQSPDLVDPWGTKLRIVETGELRWTTSAGPDRLFDTPDDTKFPSAVPR